MSQVWKSFEQLMSDKGLIKETKSIIKQAQEQLSAPTSSELSKIFDAQLAKTAGKKDEDYNVKVPAAGPDTKVEDSGYDLVEIAHPEQIQVANSRLNDGIVENDVETQKVMVDVTMRPSRGVLADLMQTLVKVANVLEQDLTDDSFRLAQEIDELLEKFAQQAIDPLSYATAINAAQENYGNIYIQFNKAAKVLRTLDFGHIWGSTKADKQMETNIKTIADKLEDYGALQSTLTQEAQMPDLLKQTYDAIKYVLANDTLVRNALSMTTDLSMDPQIAASEWVELHDIALKWSSKISPLATSMDKNPVQSKNEPHQPVSTMAPKAAPEAAAKPSMHHYSAHGQEVEELQKAIGLNGKNDIDGKFGPQTFAAVMQASKDNYNLREYLHENPGLMRGYENWNTEAVEKALASIQQFKRGPGSNVAVNTPPPLVPAPDTRQLAKQQMGPIAAQKYPNAEMEGALLYLNGKGNSPVVRREEGKWKQVG